MLSAANLRFRISSPVVLLLTVILCSLAGSILAPALAEEDGKIRSVLTEALILGPLPVPPPDAEAPPLRGNVVSVPEIDLMGRFPQIGQKVSLAPDQTTKWSKAKVDGQGSVRIPGGGVFWLATHLVVDGWTNLEIKVVGKGEHRIESLRLAEIFRAEVIDASTTHFVFQLTGRSVDVDRFISLMTELGLAEVSRTGIAAIGRGAKVL